MYRDNNLDIVLAEKDVLKKENASLKKQNEQLERQDRNSAGITVARYGFSLGIIITATVASIMTGQYNWLYLLIFGWAAMPDH